MSTSKQELPTYQETTELLLNLTPQKKEKHNFLIGVIVSSIIFLVLMGVGVAAFVVFSTKNQTDRLVNNPNVFILETTTTAVPPTEATTTEVSLDRKMEKMKITTEESRISSEYDSTKLDNSNNLGKTSTATPACQKRIVGYYRLGSDIDLRDSQLSLLTHVILALNWQVFSPLAASFDEIQVLIDSITSFIEEHDIDGVDINWRFPDNGELLNLSLLCKELRLKFSDRGKGKTSYIISVVTGASESNIPEDAMKYIDFLNVDSTQYYGWYYPLHGKKVGPPSPLFSGHGEHRNKNVDQTFKAFSCRTRSPHKLNIAVPFGGLFWKNVIVPGNSSDTLWMTAEKKNGEVDGGWISWRKLKTDWNLTSTKWNSESLTPYIWEPSERSYLAFENERSLEEKIKYSIKKNIGGIVICILNQDDDEDTLLKVIAAVKQCSKKYKTNVEYKC
ncbi:unnamed protein product [Caenorhabditis brenneri]